MLLAGEMRKKRPGYGVFCLLIVYTDDEDAVSHVPRHKTHVRANERSEWRRQLERPRTVTNVDGDSNIAGSQPCD